MSLRSPDRRIALAEPPVADAAAPLAVVVCGHWSGPAADAADAVAEAARLGFVPGDDGLHGVPLRLPSVSAFRAAFPGAAASWTEQCLRDVFAGAAAVWVVRVDTDDGPGCLDAYARAGAATGIEVAMAVPDAGLLLLPELERLCLTTALPPPGVPLAPVRAPAFAPLAAPVAAPVAANAAPAPPAAANPVLASDVLASVSRAITRARPDMLCVFALPLGADPRESVPVLVRRAPERLYGADAAPTASLPGIQALAPLLRDGAGALSSATGSLAAVIAARADAGDIWRTLAGVPLAAGRSVLRQIDTDALDALRADGIAVLRLAGGRTVLDDDVLAWRRTPFNADRRAGGPYRLRGFLSRALRRLGEQLVFENALDDARVELALTGFFAQLQRRGALTGRAVDEAVTIVRAHAGEAAVAYAIAYAPSLAIEAMRLSFADGAVSAA